MKKAEIIALLALCLFLPLYEAPKTLAWLAYLLAWLANRARQRDFGGPWDLWDTLIAAWIASAFVVAAFAGLKGDEWRAGVDVVRYGSVLWLLKRSDYSVDEQRLALFTLVVSTLIGLAAAHWRLWALGAEFLELNSVGHVNHSAVYCAIMLGACAAWLFAGGGLLAAATVLIVLFSVVISASRAGIGVALFMLVVLGLAWWPRSRRPLAVAAVLVGVTVALMVFGRAEVVVKHQRNVEQQNVLSFRDGIWRAALVAWQRYPVFGIGMDNYKLLKMDLVERWRKEAGKPFDAKDYSEFPHAHSLYLTTLAERGLVGAAALAAVLLAWFIALARHRPRRESPEVECMWWGSAAGAFMITTGVGLVNTTLHHEHGILAMLFLGMWLGARRVAATSSGRSSTPT
jgi:O-antigen ligase